MAKNTKHITHLSKSKYPLHPHVNGNWRHHTDLIGLYRPSHYTDNIRNSLQSRCTKTHGTTRPTATNYIWNACGQDFASHMEQDSNQFSRDLWEDTVMTSSETAGSNVQTMSNIHSFLQGLIDGEWFLPSQPELSVSFQPVLSVQGHSTSDRPVSPRGLGQG